MGPPGFWSELRRSGASKPLQSPAVEELLEGKAVAVDVAVWLYEAQLQHDVVMHFGPIGAAVKVVFERCVRWLRKGVLPVMVLEGTGGGRSARVCSRGHGGLGSAFAAQNRVRTLLEALGVPCMHAEGEAEATCAALVAAGICDFVATTDADALLFGAPRVLHSLHLSITGKSECELWDAKAVERCVGLDRNALITAAFLVGCDYDCRHSQASQGCRESQYNSSQAAREGAGVQGIGLRQAFSAARELRVAGDGDALRAFRETVCVSRVLETPASEIARSGSRCHGCQCCGHGNVRKKVHGKKGCIQCGTTSGCLPRLAQGGCCECSHCIAVAAAGGSDIVQAARVLHRLRSRAMAEPGCFDGFTAVVQQYCRHVDHAATVAMASGGFVWKGVDACALQASVQGVFSSTSAPDKVQPLQLEWALRTIASDCPREVRANVVARQKWAASRGLLYLPLSAKSSKVGADRAPHVLVEWARVQADDLQVLQLPHAARFARTSLAHDCGLLEADARRPRALADAFARVLAECPFEIRESNDALLAWGRTHNIPLVPTAGRRLRTGRIQVIWSCVYNHTEDAKAKLVVASKDAERFGGAFKLAASHSSLLVGQRTLKDFFVSPKARSDKSGRDVDTSDREVNTQAPATPRQDCRASIGHEPLTPVKTRMARKRWPSEIICCQDETPGGSLSSSAPFVPALRDQCLSSTTWGSKPTHKRLRSSTTAAAAGEGA